MASVRRIRGKSDVRGSAGMPSVYGRTLGGLRARGARRAARGSGLGAVGVVPGAVCSIALGIIPGGIRIGGRELRLLALLLVHVPDEPVPDVERGAREEHPFGGVEEV